MDNLWGFLRTLLAGSLALGAVTVAYQYFRAVHAARAALQRLGSQVIETSCGPVEYLRSGQGCPVLVVHGALGGCDQGLFLSRSISALDTQVICVSRFGYLRSPVPAGASLDLQADAFASLLDALEIQRAAVFAVSAGTTSALRFAARHPERVSALVLLGPDAPGEQYMALPPRFVFDVLMRSDFLYWVAVTFFGKRLQAAFGLVPNGCTLTPEQAALANRVLAGNLPIRPRIDGLIFETYTCEEDLQASVTPASPYPLSTILTPTLVVSAADDPISLPENVRRLADQLPNARQYVVPDGGHLFYGHAEEVRAEIRQFLRDHAPNGSPRAIVRNNRKENEPCSI